jgi:hypothetical protein
MDFWLVCLHDERGLVPLRAFATREEAAGHAGGLAGRPPLDGRIVSRQECRIVEFRAGRPVAGQVVGVVPLGDC